MARDHHGLDGPSRLRDLKALAHEFNTHLRETPGNVLSGDVRCAVAQAARDCFRDCSGCLSMPQNQSAWKGKSTFRTISLIRHTPQFPIVDTKPRIREALTNMVHALVHHQIHLDSGWLESTVVALAESGIIPLEFQERQRQYLVWGCFCEVALLAAISHGIRMTFLAMGKDVPPLPPTSPTEPTYLDFNDLVRRDRTVRLDQKVANAPYLKASDIYINSSETKRLGSEGLASLQEHLSVYSGMAGLIFAPEDLAFANFMRGVYYCDADLLHAPYKPLNPENRCTSYFSRHDAEFVAVLVSDAYDCGYCKELHLSNRSLATDLLKNNERRNILTDFTLAVVAQPLVDEDDDGRRAEESRQTLVQEYGEETLLEAAGIIGWMEAITRLVDATGKKPIPKSVQHTTLCVSRCLKLCG